MPALGDGNCPSDYHCCSSSSIIPALGLQCTAAGQQSNTGGGHGYSVRDLVANEGQDVGTGSASNVPVDQCAARCDATPGCLSFAHRTDDNACWPKTQCVGSGDPNSGKLASEPTWKTYYKPGCSGTTGPPVAAGTVVPPGWVPVGFGWPNIGSGAVGSYLARRLVGPEVSDEGQELGGSTDASLDDCKRLCDQTSGCKSFSYSPNYRDCWVKDKCVTTADPDSRKLEWESHWMTYYKGSCTKTKPPAVVKKVLKLLQKASVLRLRLSRLFEKLLKLLRRKIPGITERQLRIAIADAVTSRHAATLQTEPNEAQVIMWVRSPNDGLEQGDLDSATNDALGDDEAKREVEDAAGGQWVSTQTASAGHPGQEAAEEEEDDESLETWQIVLIVVLIVLCICIVIIALVVISKRKKAAAGDQGAQKREAGEEMGKAGSQQEPEGVGSPATATEDAPLKQSKKAKDQPWQHPDEPVAGKLGGQTGPTESQQHASQQPRANDYQQPPSAAAVGGATGPTGDSTYESGATGYTELGMIPDPAGTRVWALYGDQYYGGEVVERQANGMYTVNWDDGTHSFDVQGETLRTR